MYIYVLSQTRRNSNRKLKENSGISLLGVCLPRERMDVHVVGIPEVMITTEKQEPEKDGLHCSEQEVSFKIVFM